VELGERLVVISVALPYSLVEKLDKEARLRMVSRSTLVKQAILAFLSEKKVASETQKPQPTKELGEPNTERQVFEAIENLRRSTLKTEEKEEDPQPQPDRPRWTYADVYRTWDTEVLEKFLSMNLDEETKKAIVEELERRKNKGR